MQWTASKYSLVFLKTESAIFGKCFIIHARMCVWLFLQNLVVKQIVNYHKALWCCISHILLFMGAFSKITDAM